MEKTIKAKRVSYGYIEIRDAGALSPRYRIYINGQIYECSDDLDTVIKIFDAKPA